VTFLSSRASTQRLLQGLKFPEKDVPSLAENVRDIPTLAEYGDDYNLIFRQGT
jgi:hypothetical protein